MTTILEVEHLAKSYGDFVAVEDVSFAVEEGEIFGILGPNGAGKTTTVECLQGLRKSDGGQARVLGLDPLNDLELAAGDLDDVHRLHRLVILGADRLRALRGVPGQPFERTAHRALFAAYRAAETRQQGSTRRALRIPIDPERA